MMLFKGHSEINLGFHFGMCSYPLENGCALALVYKGRWITARFLDLWFLIFMNHSAVLFSFPVPLGQLHRSLLGMA